MRARVLAGMLDAPARCARPRFFYKNPLNLPFREADYVAKVGPVPDRRTTPLYFVDANGRTCVHGSVASQIKVLPAYRNDYRSGTKQIQPQAVATAAFRLASYSQMEVCDAGSQAIGTMSGLAGGSAIAHIVCAPGTVATSPTVAGAAAFHLTCVATITGAGGLVGWSAGRTSSELVCNSNISVPRGTPFTIAIRRGQVPQTVPSIAEFHSLYDTARAWLHNQEGLANVTAADYSARCEVASGTAQALVRAKKCSPDLFCQRQNAVRQACGEPRTCTFTGRERTSCGEAYRNFVSGTECYTARVVRDECLSDADVDVDATESIRNQAATCLERVAVPECLPFTGEGRTCDDARFTQLRKQKTKFCRQAGCKQGRNCRDLECSEFRRRYDEGSECLRIRNLISKECYAGQPDPNDHPTEEQNERNRMDACRTCMSDKRCPDTP